VLFTKVLRFKMLPQDVKYMVQEHMECIIFSTYNQVLIL